VIRELIGRLGQIAARVYSMIIVKDINAAAAVIDGDPGKPLAAIVARPAVDKDRIREVNAAVGTSLEGDVTGVPQVIVGIYEVDIAPAWSRRIVDRESGRRADPVVSQHLVHREEG